VGHRFGLMPPEKSLVRSILLHGALFYLGQAALMVVMSVSYAMGWKRLALFLGISLAYHALLTTALLLRRQDFRLETTGQALDRVNLPNTLTFVRLSFLPAILFLVIQAQDYPATLPVILPVICIVFATDFLDGIAARRRGEITFVGRYLDSASDYLTIIGVTIVLFVFGLLPTWFFVLVLGRLVLFAIGMALLALREGKADPLATFLGKVSVFSLMALYALEVAHLFSVPWIGDETVVTVILYVVAGIVALSIVDKAIFLGRRFAAPASRRSSASGAD
jgi:phosphatidylglycerophosphate synthase